MRTVTCNLFLCQYNFFIKLVPICELVHSVFKCYNCTHVYDLGFRDYFKFLHVYVLKYTCSVYIVLII